MSKIPMRTKYKHVFIHLHRRNLVMLASIAAFILDSIESTIENTIRLLLISMPLYVYVALLQLRDKPQSTNSIANHLTSQSTMQFIAPGVLLVCTDGSEYKGQIEHFKKATKELVPSIVNIIKLLAYISTVVIAIAAVYYIRLRGLI